MASITSANSTASTTPTTSTTSPSLMQSLLEGSVPDDTPCSYYGPPIGYSELVVKHITPIGYATTTTTGTVTACRPKYHVDCEDEECFVCIPHSYLPTPSTGGVKIQPLGLYEDFAVKGTQRCDESTQLSQPMSPTGGVKIQPLSLNASFAVKGTQRCDEPLCKVWP